MTVARPLTGFAAALCLFCLPQRADASPRDAVFGCWLAENGDSVLYIHSEGSSLVGEIAALKDATYGAGEDKGAEGQPRKDDNNPDAGKRGRPLLGMNILVDFAYDDGWEGEIYDPESGDNYSSTIRVDDDGKLELRGYVGFKWLGRTVYYVDPETNAKRRDELFAISGANDPCATES